MIINALPARDKNLRRCGAVQDTSFRAAERGEHFLDNRNSAAATSQNRVEKLHKVLSSQRVRTIGKITNVGVTVQRTGEGGASYVLLFARSIHSLRDQGEDTINYSVVFDSVVLFCVAVVVPG
jgi:hypothetical protein